MGVKETGDPASNLNLSKSNRTAGGDPEGGDAPDMVRSGVATGAGAAAGAARTSVGSGSKEQRLSTNMTVERQTPKRDFGD